MQEEHLRVQDDYSTALDSLTQSLTIQQEIGDKAGESYTCLNVGRVLHALPTHIEHNKAKYYLNKAYQIAKEIGLADVLAQFEQK